MYLEGMREYCVGGLGGEDRVLHKDQQRTHVILPDNEDWLKGLCHDRKFNHESVSPLALDIEFPSFSNSQRHFYLNIWSFAAGLNNNRYKLDTLCRWHCPQDCRWCAEESIFLEEASGKCWSFWSSTIEMASWLLNRTARHTVDIFSISVNYRLSSRKDHCMNTIKTRSFPFCRREDKYLGPHTVEQKWY